MLDPDSWLGHISILSPLGFALVALTGLVTGVAPSSLPLAFVVAGCAGGQVDTAASNRIRRGLLLAAGFVLGLVTVDTAVGLVFGFIGFTAIQLLDRSLAITNLIIGGLLVLFGLALLRKIRIKLPVFRPRPHRVDSFLAAYVLGIPFGLSVCPACTPMVLPLLGAAALTGSPLVGAAVLLTFGLARGMPLLVVGAAADWVKRVPRSGAWMAKIEKGSGVLLLIASAYFFYVSAASSGLFSS